MNMMDTMSLTLGLVLIGAGFLLLVAELFVPSGGCLFVLSIASIAVGVTLTFSYDTTVGLFTLLFVFVATPAVAGAMLHYWPRTHIGRRMFLTGTAEEDTVASLSVNKELEGLKGKIGRTLSALRPAGVVDFDGRRVDSLTEGMMVDPGQWVRCIDVRAGRVLVRPVDRPNLDALENVDFS
jgi:membrane-bound serine protease (ClpP class)